jgi:hypothetical protein
MNSNRYLADDIFSDDHSIREAAEQFQRVIHEISAATSTGIPYVRAFVRKLGDEGNEKEAKAVAKEFQELLNRTQKLFKLAASSQQNYKTNRFIMLASREECCLRKSFYCV